MDFFDTLNLILISLIFGRLVSSTPKHREALALGWAFCLLVILESTNRVIGYPDRKYMVMETGILIAEVALAILIVIRGKMPLMQNRILLLFLMLINIYIPVMTFPSIWLRHAWVKHKTQAAITRWRPTAIVSKVTDKHITAIQKSGEDTLVISYVWNRQDPPRVYLQTSLLSAKSGSSKEAQKLNQPYEFISMMRH